MDIKQYARLTHLAEELDKYHTRGHDPFTDQIVRDLVEEAKNAKEDIASEIARRAADSVLENPINAVLYMEAEAEFLEDGDYNQFTEEMYGAFDDDWTHPDDYLRMEAEAEIQSLKKELYGQLTDEGQEALDEFMVNELSAEALRKVVAE